MRQVKTVSDLVHCREESLASHPLAGLRLSGWQGCFEVGRKNSSALSLKWIGGVSVGVVKHHAAEISQMISAREQKPERPLSTWTITRPVDSHSVMELLIGPWHIGKEFARWTKQRNAAPVWRVKHFES